MRAVTRCPLAVCAILRDERPYLAEWIAFHRAVGVERFFLYDNGSHDDPGPLLAPWIRAGLVTLTDWPTPFAAGAQTAAYQHCLDTQRTAARWIAFLDIDEFLFSPAGATLPQVLGAYERHPGVVVNWQAYGTSHRNEAGDGLVIDRFLRRAPRRWVRNRRVKSIVDPQAAVRPLGPHFFEFAGGAQAVTENHTPVNVLPRSPARRRLRRWLARIPRLPVDPYAVREVSGSRVSVARLRINHYIVRSRQEYADKTRRYRPEAVGSPQAAYGAHHFCYHDRNDVYDPILQRYSDEVRRRMGELATTSHLSPA